MKKLELRKKYKALRASLSATDVLVGSRDIADIIDKLDIWGNNYFHVFMSIAEQKEIDTNGIIDLIKAKGKNVIISASDIKTRDMYHYLLNDNVTIEKSVYNIPEPISGDSVGADIIDVLFIPLLAYDKKGNRIGYGAGFYDKFLKGCKPSSIKIGLSFFPPEEDFRSEEHDIPLDACISPKGIIRF